MEDDELLIDNNEESFKEVKLSATAGNISSLFKMGEWKKALEAIKRLPLPKDCELQDFIEIYKSACKLACKIIESQNIKLGIHICKKLNKIVSSQDPKHFVPSECEVLNYIACAYKQANKLYLAKKYIDKAMRITNDFRHEKWEKSNTFLNMCAILSAMGKHKEAILYAKNAIEVTQEELVEIKFSNNHSETMSKASVLGIAYHNYAVEEEYLGNIGIAMINYKKALKVVEKNAPNNLELIEKFRGNYSSVKRKQVKPSRPSSAKSAVSMKPGVLVRVAKNPAPGNLQAQFKMKPSSKHANSSAAVNEECAKADLEFLSFKNQCKEFLSSNRDWFKPEVPHPKTQYGYFEGKKPLNPRNSRPQTASVRPRHESFEIKTENVLVITAPTKGIENIRAPVLHEISLVREQPKEKPIDPFPKSEESIKILNQPSRKSTKPPILSKKSSVVFVDTPKNEVTVFQVFDEVGKEVERENSKENASENVSCRKSMTKDEVNRFVAKLQARYRGRIAREKFALLLKKVSILHRGAKRIQGILCMITLISRDSQMHAVINEGDEEYRIEIVESLQPQEIIERLDKNQSGFYLKDSSDQCNIEEIKNSKVKISDEDYEVKYLFSQKTSTLIVRATKNSNSQVYTLEKLIKFTSQTLLLQYIQDEVQPFLQIIDHTLVITKQNPTIEREFLAKGTRILQKKEFIITANKIIKNEEVSLEFTCDCADLNVNIKQLFLVSEVLSSLSIFNLENIESDPHLSLLALHYHGQNLVLRKLNKNFLEIVHSATHIINNYEYFIKVFKIQDDSITYFFEAFNPASPEVQSFSITDKDLSGIYKTQPKRIKPNIEVIARSLQIKGGKLLLTPKQLRKMTTKGLDEVSIKKIQALFRGYLVRDRLKVQYPKTPLIFTLEKSFENFSVCIMIYKIQESFILEILNAKFEKSFYLLVSNPKVFFKKSSRFFDVKSIANSISYSSSMFRVPSSKGEVDFIPCKYYSAEEQMLSEKALPLLLLKVNPGEEYAIFCRELPNKTLLVKLIPTGHPECPFRIFPILEISELLGSFRPLELLKLIRYQNGSILLSELQELPSSSPKQEEKIIFRTCKQISSKLYQVSLSLTMEQEEVQSLLFTLRQGSLASLSKTIEVEVEEACSRTGFTKGYLIPMADYMIRHLLCVQEDRFIFDYSRPVFNIDRNILRIQATVRGYIARRKLMERVCMACLAKTKAVFNGEMVTVMIYKKNEDFMVIAVRGIDVLSMYLDNKIVEDHYLQLDKFLQAKIVPKMKLKVKNELITLCGLSEYKRDHNKDRPPRKRSSIKVSSFSSRNGSSYHSPKSIASFLLTPTDQESGKVLKWRSPRTISNEKCLVSVYELPDKGMIDVFIIAKDLTLSLDISKSQLSKPEITVGQLEISDDKIQLKASAPDLVYADKRYISNRYAELSIFKTEQGFNATAFLPEGNKSLSVYLGVDVDPKEVSRLLKIEEIMGKDVLLVDR